MRIKDMEAKLDDPVGMAHHIKACDLCDKILSDAMTSIQQHYKAEAGQ